MLQLFKAKSLKKTRESLTSNVEEKTREKNKKQKGRSMVEMLGVLAIIGVLSIGGIQGYTIAMRRYQVNEAINTANKYALTLYTTCLTAMNQNPEQYYVSLYHSNLKYWSCPKLDFTDSGIGALPNGVTEISLGDEVTTKRGDVVGIYIQFTSKELCMTLRDITGGEWSFSEDITDTTRAEEFRKDGETACKDLHEGFISFLMN